MVDSPHHPEEEVIFALGEAGVIDPEDAEKKPKKAASKKEIKKTTKKDTPKEKTDLPEVDIQTTEDKELKPIEIPEITATDGQELTVEIPEDLVLSEALDEEFSDSSPKDE